MVRIHEAGINRKFEHVIEFGPGDSLGTGFAALISGSKSYTALDAHPYRNINHEINIFDDIVDLFRRREPIPAEAEFARIRPTVKSYAFPEYIFDNVSLNNALSHDRINRLRTKLLESNNETNPIRYIAPWAINDLGIIARADLVISQAVFEYIDNIEELYKMVCNMLSAGGVMSATIDYSAHHLSKTGWNDHLKYSSFIWWLLKGNQPYFLNRKVHSDHINEIDNSLLDIVLSERTRKPSSVDRIELAKEFRDIDDEDLHTSGGYIIAKAP